MQAGPYDAVVFAGGGCRCAWQAGFWETAAPRLGIVPRVVGAVSAGALMASMLLAGTGERGLAYFKARTAANPRNLYPGNLLRRAPLFPHEGIYRDTILACLDAEALRRLHAGPDLRVLLARPPWWLGARSSVVVGFVAWHADGVGTPSVHGRAGRRAGFHSEIVSVRECGTPEALADLILHSSCTPPLTPVYRRGGRPVLDGGLVDAVPVEAVGPRPARTLVLLTRRHPPQAIPAVPGRTYVQPSRHLPIQRWDYTSPALVQATYDIGRRDGERFTASGALGA